MSADLLFKDVLVVEDEAQFARTLSVALKHLQLPARFATTLAGARLEVQKELPDLILLDRMLPDGDGLSLCEELRATSTQPLPLIIILSARGQIEERVAGLDSGADDYLPKPFSVDELHARIRALSRRYPLASAAAKLGPTVAPPFQEEKKLWKMDVNTQKVLGPNGWINVTQLEFKLLEKFLTQPGETLSRDDLLKDVWGFQWLPKTRTVDFFISRVRKNFEKDPDSPKHFITVRGIGYRFDP
ncbi:MAG: response regulator transcription factor [Bdellovibrionota bacterium]